MRKRNRWRWIYGLGWLLKFAEIISAQCDGEIRSIVAKEPQQGFITSPNYPHSYASGLHCIYELKAPMNAGLIVRVKVVDLDITEPYSGSGQCLYDYLSFIVVDRDGREHVDRRLCGQDMQSASIDTLQSHLLAIFVSTDQFLNHNRRRGFRFFYEFITEAEVGAPQSFYYDSDERFRKDCGGSTASDELSGEISSPGFPNMYPRNVSCNWLIRVSPGKRIYLRLIHLQLSTTVAECDRSSLTIFDGYRHDQPTGPRVDEVRFCGSHLYYNEEGMKSYLSDQNRLVIRFVTTDYPSVAQQQLHETEGTAIGFKILWTEVISLVDEDEDCRGFMCSGGEFCIDDGQKICGGGGIRLCLNETLRCNRVANCAENDKSDEEYCYPEEVLTITCVGVLSAVFACVFCFAARRMLLLCRSTQSSRPNPKPKKNFHSQELFTLDNTITTSNSGLAIWEMQHLSERFSSSENDRREFTA